jgi:predicted dehydrogenase
MNNQPNSIKDKDIQFSRRDFIGTGLLSGAVFTIVPRQVLGGPGQTPPSDKLNIAVIGAGGMGGSNTRNVSHENIVALCDVDEKRAAETFELHPKAKRYRDFRVMLDKQKDIDAVIVATPDNTHAVAAMMAIKLGKHVYVQKPLTHDIYEARKLTEAAREAKVATQMGNQGHSGEGVRLICEWLWDGAIGPVREAVAWTDRPGRYWEQGHIGRPAETPPVPPTLDWDLWLGPAPYRPYHPIYVPHDWRGWWDFGCGAFGDMGCHVLDPVFTALKLGYPISVEASTTPVNNETYPAGSLVYFNFPAREDMPPVKLSWFDGGLMPERPEELEAERQMGNGASGVIFIGDKGKLMCGEYGDSPRLIPETKMREYTLPPKTLPRVNGTHEQNWLDACKGGEPACSNFEYSGPMAEVVLLGNLAIRTREKLYWDGPNMTATNMPELDRYVRREYREGWNL